ncbi:MAG: hypothetical protein JNG83_11525 [Opitutaceae bacterium]|nr:hypothetical protein [Opitutaceae bacterium]
MSRITVSYDVFDTVVTRAFAHPRDVFVHVGDLLRQRAASPLDALAFARARWESELAARRLSPWTEVLLDDIYRQLAARLGWSEAAALAARDLELEVESRHLRGVPFMRPVIAADRAEAGRVLFISDMYLPAAILRGWLIREGVMAESDAVFVSGEGRANKNSGQLFHVVARETGASPGAWRHAGDHPVADVAKPRELGLSARHLTHAHLTRREQRARGTTGEFAVTWRSLLAGAMRLARLERAPAADRAGVLWDSGTTVAGPLFYGFVRWVLAEAGRRGVRRLYFLARDGQIFWRIARAILEAEPQPVECHYLQASRVLFTGPAELRDPAALRRLVAPAVPFHSLRQALLPLGLDEAWGTARLPPAFRALDWEANLEPAQRAALADWLLDPARRPELEAAAQRRAGQARAYLHAAGLRAGEPVAVVDAGWFGTIQRSLEHILGDGSAPAPLRGFYVGLMAHDARRFAGEALGYTNRFAPLPLLREESHKVLIELMAQGDHGQAAGFEERGGRWTVRLQDTGPVNLAEVRLLQEAALAFTHRALATATVAAAPEADFARAVIGIYRDFHDRPEPREAEVWGSLPHSDQYYEQRHATLCAELGFGATIAALLDHRKRPPHWWIAGQATLRHPLPLQAFRLAKRGWWRLRGRAE